MKNIIIGVLAVFITIYVADAIEPTAAGEIGVNLVGPIPSPSALVGKIGKNTKYLTDLGGSITAWKGPDPSYITQTIITATNTIGEVTTTTKDASIVVSQDEAGNFNILLGPDLRAKLSHIAEEVPKCVVVRKRSGSCGYMAFAENVFNNGPLTEVAEIENAMPAGRLVIPANDIAALVAMFRGGAANTVTLPVAAGGGTLGLLYLIYLQWHESKTIPAALDIPNTVAGTKTTTLTPSPTAKTCPVGNDRPRCPDNDCRGDRDKRCTEGEHKGCKCGELDVMKTRDMAEEWIDLQSVIRQITLATTAQPEAVCEKDKFELSIQLWKSISAQVCASRPLTENFNTVVTARDVGFKGYHDWNFTLDWQYDKGDCDFGCEEMFAGFPTSISCSNQPEVFSASGVKAQACGKASFSIKRPSEVCVERIIIDCIYHYIDRPELSMAECPRIPILDSSCHKDPPATEVTETSPAKATAPVMETNPPREYCMTSKTSNNYCYFTVELLFNRFQLDALQTTAFTYDPACHEIGQSKDVRKGASIPSKLPYAVSIEEFRIEPKDRYDNHDYVVNTRRSMIIMRISYAGQVVNRWWDNEDNPLGTERSLCTEVDMTVGDQVKKVSRCQFDCSKVA